MKKFLLLLSLTSLVGCMPQLPSIPEVPEIPEVEIPEVEVPTTFPTIAPEPALPSPPVSTGSTAFKSCVAGYVQTGPGTGTLDIYTPITHRDSVVQSIDGISPEFMETYEMEPC